MQRARHGIASKFIASLVSLSLLLLAPGPFCYQALAQSRHTLRTENRDADAALGNQAGLDMSPALENSEAVSAVKLDGDNSLLASPDNDAAELRDAVAGNSAAAGNARRAMRNVLRRQASAFAAHRGPAGKKALQSLGLAGLLGEKAFPALQREKISPAAEAVDGSGAKEIQSALAPSAPPTGASKSFEMPAPAPREEASSLPAAPRADSRAAPQAKAKSLATFTEEGITGFFGYRWVRGQGRQVNRVAIPDGWDIPQIIAHIAAMFNSPVSEVEAFGRAHRLPLTGMEGREKWIEELEWADFLRHRDNRAAFEHEDHRKYEGGAVSRAWLRAKAAFGYDTAADEDKFPAVAGKNYLPGVAGALQRAGEFVAKPATGAAIRFPYHLFDMFLFGYFRRDISYMFRHYNEDFIPLGPGAAKKYLESGRAARADMSLGSAATQFQESLWARMDATRARSIGLRAPALMWAQLVIWALADGLTKFLIRRFNMAVKSAVAMGVVAALASIAPLSGIMSFSMMGIPGIGALIGIFAQYAPIGVGAVFGDAAAHVVSAAINAMIPDLVFGKMLNTMTLSAMLTFSPAHKQRLVQKYGRDYQKVREMTDWGSLLSAEAWGERLKSLAPGGGFWSQNFKSMGGLMTVGSEIEGIMTYAGSIDGAVSSAVGHDVKILQTIGASIERGQGESPIPFGGAITWGNLLLYKLQNALGWNLTDWVYGELTGAVKAADSDLLIPMARNLHAAQDGNARSAQLFHYVYDKFKPAKDSKGKIKADQAETKKVRNQDAAAAADDESAPAGGDPPKALDAKTGKSGRGVSKSASQSHADDNKARTEQAIAQAGDWDKEIEQVREHAKELNRSLQDKLKELAELEAKKKPVTAQDRALYEKAMAKLDKLDREEYAESKLAEYHDLINQQSLTDEQYTKLQDLEKWAKENLWPVGEDPGFQNALGSKVAGLKTVQDALVNRMKDLNDRSKNGDPQIDPKLEKQIKEKLDTINLLQDKAKTELANFTAADRMLAVENKLRNLAAAPRRNTEDLRKVHEGLARLSMYQDIRYTLDIINSAENALHDMLGLLDKKAALVSAADASAATLAQQAQNNLNNGVPQWNQTVANNKNGDVSNADNMKTLSGQAALGVQRIPDFQKQVSNVFDGLKAEGGKTAYQNRLNNIIPKIAGWLKDGKPLDPNNPSGPKDPNYLSLAQIMTDRQKALDNLNKANDGINNINTKLPSEYDVLLVYDAPNIRPEPAAHHPQIGDAQVVLQHRLADWTAQKQDYDNQLADALGRIAAGGTNHSGSATEADEFGDTHPYSLVDWGNQEAAARDAAHSDFNRLVNDNAQGTGFNQLVASINSVTGANLPTLSDASLPALQTAVQNYADKVNSVTFPDKDTNDVFVAKMNLILLGQTLVMIAKDVVDWSKHDGYFNAIDDGKKVALTVSHTLQEVVNMHKDVIDDVAMDQAFLNAWGRADLTTKRQMGEKVKARKLALLEGGPRPVDGRSGNIYGVSYTNVKYGTPTARNYIGIKTAVTDAMSMIDNTLIPFQNRAIARANPAPNAGDLAKLYDGKIKLYDAVNKALNQTFPWALASWGAPFGNGSAGGHNIDVQVKKFNQYLNGANADGTYADDNGVVQKSIARFQREVDDRMKSNFNADDGPISHTEMVYGVQQPFSLPDKIAAADQVKQTAITQYNNQVRTIKQIFARIDSMSGGATHLSDQYNLPYPLSAGDPSASTTLHDWTDKQGTAPSKFEVLGGQLTALGDKYNTGTVTVSGSKNQLAPTGPQPTPVADTNHAIAMLFLEAGERLVNSAQQSGSMQSATNAAAQYLFWDKTKSVAQDAMQNQIPRAKAFLAEGAAALNQGLQDLTKDRTYVSNVAGGGTGTESVDAMVRRKLPVFKTLQKFTSDADAFFRVTKFGWDAAESSTVQQATQYWQGIATIADKSTLVGSKDIQEIQQMRDVINSQLRGFDDQRNLLTTYLQRLGQPGFGPSAQVMSAISDIQSKNLPLLVENKKFHIAEEQRHEADLNLKDSINQLNRAQEEMVQLLNDHGIDDLDKLPEALANAIDLAQYKTDAVMVPGSSKDDPQMVAVRKNDFYKLVDPLLRAFQAQNQLPDQNFNVMRDEILKDPTNNLSRLLPNSQLINFGGDDPDGFYLIYNSQVSTPRGIGQQMDVTLGNWDKIFGNNLSLHGYSVNNPIQDVPWGDKGLGIRIESLQNKDFINYLDIDVHRMLQNVPTGLTTQEAFQPMRMFIFENMAFLVAGDKIYGDFAGFADFGLAHPSQQTAFYGGSGKVEFKFNEIAKLSVQQQNLLATDPRSFVETLNLNSLVPGGGYDQLLDQDFIVSGHGRNMFYSRSEIGPSFNLQQAFKTSNPISVDFFFAHQKADDDYTQDSIGGHLMTGFTVKRDDGSPLMNISNRVGPEIGQQYNQVSDRLNVNFPDWGINFTDTGRLIGAHALNKAQITKQLNERTSLGIGYGSDFPGQEDRLYVNWSSQYTLRQLWNMAGNATAETMNGGQITKDYDKDMKEFLDGNAPKSKTVEELSNVYKNDIAHVLISKNIGQLVHEIQEARKAGSIMDKTTIRGMLGVVSHGVGDTVGDRAVAGGGPQASTYIDTALTKTPKSDIKNHIQKMYRESVQLEASMLELTEKWQAAVEEIAEAQWDMTLAGYLKSHATIDTYREAEVREAKARDRLHQALINYNAMTGREPGAPNPFENLSTADLKALIDEIRKTVSSPTRLTQIIGSLNPEQLKMKTIDGRNVEKDPLNLLDYLPGIDQFTFSVGALFSTDLMASQLLGVAMTARIPVYDPGSKDKEKWYVLDDQATIKEMQSVYQDFALKTQKDALQEAFWDDREGRLSQEAQKAAQLVSDARKAYNAKLMTEPEFRRIVNYWWDTERAVVEAAGKASLAGARRSADKTLAKTPSSAPAVTITTLADAFKAASSNVPTLEAMAERAKGAGRLMEANAHRIEKGYLAWTVGTNLTASGMAWIPELGITGYYAFIPKPGVDFKPAELQALQNKQGEANVRMFNNMKANLEANLALEFFQNLMAINKINHDWDRLEDGIRQAQNQLFDAQNRRKDGKASFGEVEQLRAKVNQAVAARNKLWVAREEAKATINYLIGRPADAPLDLGPIDENQAVATLKNFLAEKSPVTAAHEVLKAKVKMAEAEEEKIDKKLAMQHVIADVVAVPARVVSRALANVGADYIANPDDVKKARAQTLLAERQLETFEKDIQSQRAAARSEIALARERGDEHNRLLLEAKLAVLGDDDLIGNAPYEALPQNFGDLNERAQKAYELMASASDERNRAAVDTSDRDSVDNGSSMNVRVFHDHETLDRHKVDKTFIEPIFELRLANRDVVDPGILLSSARILDAQADSLYRTNLAKARALGAGLIAEFEGNVGALRSAQLSEKNPDAAPGRKNFAELERLLTGRLNEQRDQIVALLHLPPKTTTLQRLMDLVPADPAALQRDPRAAAQRFVETMKTRKFELISRTLYEQGMPEDKGDQKLDQLRASVIARQFSHNGFTPVLVDAWFRGHNVPGAFLEAPDPRYIAVKLQEILSDAVSKELEEKGLKQKVVLRIQLLLSSVADKQREVEKYEDLIDEAGNAYLSAVAQNEKGLISDQEMNAAHDRLTGAWGAFAETVADLKHDFVMLVSELEAMGAADKIKKTPNRNIEIKHKPIETTPAQRVLKYWSGRMLDENLEAKLDAILSGLQVSTDLDRKAIAKYRSDLTEAVRTYRLMEDNAGSVPYMNAFSDSRKAELVMMADAAGRREQVEEALQPLAALLGADPNKLKPHEVDLRSKLMTLLREDVEAQVAGAKMKQTDELKVLDSMRDAYWHNVRVSPDAEAVFQNLEKLHHERFDAKQDLLESYMISQRNPAEFVMRDKMLDKYLTAEAAFDRAMIKAFDNPDIKNDPKTALGLDGLYGLQESITRQKDLHRFGRGMGAINALIWLQEGRLSALRFERGAPDEYEQVASVLERLQQTQERWQSNPKELTPLYAVTDTEKDGTRLWKIDEWYSEDQLVRDTQDSAKYYVKDNGVTKRTLHKDSNGRLWIMDGDKQTTLELVSGLDAAESKKTDAHFVNVDNKTNINVFKALQGADFALTELKEGVGDVRATLTYREFEALNLGSDPKVFYFAKKADPKTGLHPAMHYLQALWSDSPDDYEIVVYRGEKKLPSGIFPNRESFDAYRHQMLISEDDHEKKDAGNFSLVRVGEKGVRAMIEAAQTRETVALRMGWVDVKTQKYGFAMDGERFAKDKDGHNMTFLTEDDFDKTLDKLKNAPDRLKKAKEKLAEATRELEKAKPDLESLQRKADEAKSHYERVQMKARQELADYFAKEMKLSATPSEKQETELRARIDKALAEITDLQEGQKATSKEIEKLIKEFKEARKDSGDAIEVAAKAKGKLNDRERDKRLAEEELKDSEAFLKNSKTWRMFKSEDMRLVLDQSKALVHVSAEAYWGKGGLERNIGTAVGKTTVIKGEVLAAFPDPNHEGRLEKVIQNKSDFWKESGKWVLEDAAGQRISAADKKIDPNMRLVHFIDPTLGLADGQAGPAGGVRAMINPSFLLDQISDARKHLTYVSHYGVWPWQVPEWFRLLTSGIVGTVGEVVSGRDPQRENFLGEVNLNKGEGGATQQKGVLGTVAAALDPFGISRNVADWYYDRSQLPKQIALSEPVRPGKNPWNLDPTADHKNIYFGRTGTERIMYDPAQDKKKDEEKRTEEPRKGYLVEDLANLRRSADMYFDGGTRLTYLETYRGRAGLFVESSITDETGHEELMKALEDPRLSNDSISGFQWSASEKGEPQHAEIEEVRRQVDLVPGAKQHRLTIDNLNPYIQVLKNRLEQAQAAAAGAEVSEQTAQKNYDEQVKLLEELKAAEGQLFDETLRMGAKIGRQDALDSMIQRLKADIDSHQAQLAQVNADLRTKIDEAKKDPKYPGSKKGPSPTDGMPFQSAALPWILWALGGSATGAAALALALALRRRKLRRVGATD